MNNYDGMSDFKINNRLSELLGWYPSDWFLFKTDMGVLPAINGDQAPIILKYRDFCNNWSDIGPLIEECKATLESRTSLPKLGWMASKDEHYHAHQNPKRAAAICIIKLLEA